MMIIKIKESNYIISLRIISTIENAFIFSKFLYYSTQKNMDFFNFYKKFLFKLTFRNIEKEKFSKLI